MMDLQMKVGTGMDAVDARPAPSQAREPVRVGGAAPRCLWLAREMPFPLHSGDRIYPMLLAKSLAEEGVDLSFVGFPSLAGEQPPADWPIRWHTVAGNRIGRLRSLFSFMPKVAAAHASATYRETLRALLLQPWDMIVIDHYGMGWVLPALTHAKGDPVVIHVSQDHETSVTHAIFSKFEGSWPMRLALWQNHVKTGWMERRIGREVDLLTTVTDHDAGCFAAQSPGVRTVTLAPGYAGPRVPQRRPPRATRRQVVMVGSYHWIAKQENVRRFAAVADPVFVAHGIELHIVGSMPPELARELQARCRSVRLFGFVESLEQTFADARLAVVPEEIGGGFKLKFLDYVFNRVPVVTLKSAVEGLPADVVGAMLCADDLDALVATIVRHIDDAELLDDLQERAYEGARLHFDWSSRGAALRRAIAEVRATDAA